jgi:hypothetical protein
MGLGIVLVFIVIGYAVAFTRKGRVGATTIGTRRQEAFIPADPPAVFARLQKISGRLQIDDADPATNRLVLSSSVSLFTWGFLYPIEIHPHGAGGSRVVIGIHSKVFQAGPLVTRAHSQCTEEISQWLAVPAARVAS